MQGKNMPVIKNGLYLDILIEEQITHYITLRVKRMICFMAYPRKGKYNLSLF